MRRIIPCLAFTIGLVACQNESVMVPADDAATVGGGKQR